MNMLSATREGCVYCGSEKSEVVGLESNNIRLEVIPRLKQCKGCGLVFVNPIPSADALASLYGDKFHYNKNRLMDYMLHTYNMIFVLADLRLITKRISRGRVLDIGLGRGDLLRMFDGHVWEKYGFDPDLSDAERERLENDHGLHVSNERLFDGTYPDYFFDLVILRNVIEHVISFKDLLSEIRRVLKPDGTLFVRTLDIDSLDFRLFKNYWYEIVVPGHVVLFSKRTLSEVLAAAGFKILYLKGNSLPIPLSLYRSLKLKYGSHWLLNFFLFPISVVYSLTVVLGGAGHEILTIAQKLD